MTNRAGPPVIQQIDWANPPVHPAAASLPMMGEDELKEMAAGIKTNGLQQPIVIFEDNRDAANGSKGPFPTYLLDGRNRLAALALLGIDKPYDAPKSKLAAYSPVRTVKAIQKFSVDGKMVWETDVDPYSMVMSLNVHRRHLTAEQKRQAIADHIKLDPSASDRKIGRKVGVSPTTVGTVRTEMEDKGDVSKLDTRTDSAGRKQPATKPKPIPKPTATAKPAPIDEDTIAEQPITTEPSGGLTENSPGQTDRVKQALENAKGAQPKQDEDDDDYYGPDDDPEYYVKMVGPEFNVLLAETVDHIHRMVDLVKAVDTDTNREVFDAYSFAVDSVISAARALSAASKDASAIERQKLKAMQEEEGRRQR